MKRTALKGGNGFKKTTNTLSSNKQMNKVSKGYFKRVTLKKQAYKEVDITRDHVCEGCGSANRPLSHSHLVSVAFDKRLEANVENIRLHCLDWDGIKGCHSKWEDSRYDEITTMLDFEENMKILQRISMPFFRIKKSKIYG